MLIYSIYKHNSIFLILTNFKSSTRVWAENVPRMKVEFLVAGNETQIPSLKNKTYSR